MTTKLPLKVKPFEHQVRACNFALDRFKFSSGVALLMEMGTCKTSTSIAIAGLLPVKKVLVVCPLSVMSVWQEEFEKFADFDYSLELKDFPEDDSFQVSVWNYESAWRKESELIAWQPDLVICDEMHKIKTHNSKVSKAMHRIGSKARFRLGLTGTAITNKAIDIFSQYKFLNPNIFGTSFYTFRNKYFDMRGYGNYTPVLKRNMSFELKRNIRKIAFRATKAECLDLPPTTDIVQPIELEPKALKIYKDLEKHFVAEVADGEITASNVLTRILRLSQLTGGYLTADEEDKPTQLSKAKLNALQDILEESDEPLVIIAHFVPEIKTICSLLDKLGISFSCIFGETKDRQEQIASFQNGEKRVFVGQISTAGLGITLTKASTMVFYSLNYSMSDFEQCKARINRAGQLSPCTYIYLTAKNTIDEKILKALESKANLAKELIDGYKRNA